MPNNRRSEERKWNDALRNLETEERSSLLRELGIQRNTLQRWIRGESVPHPDHALELGRVLPRTRLLTFIEGLRQMTPRYAIIAEQIQRSLTHDHIPSAYYQDIVEACTNQEPALRFETVSFLAQTQMRHILDPLAEGCLISFLRCSPPGEDGRVRTLYHASSLGTVECLERQTELIFIGSNSMSGQCVLRERDLLYEGHQVNKRLRSLFLEGPLMSVFVTPLRIQGGGIGGALTISSIREGFFTPERIALLHAYAELVVHAIPSCEMYSLLDLSPVPNVSQQRPILEMLRHDPDRYFSLGNAEEAVLAYRGHIPSIRERSWMERE